MDNPIEKDTKALLERVSQFRTLSLPGQPMSMHMGTMYLVNDLVNEIERLRRINVVMKMQPVIVPKIRGKQFGVLVDERYTEGRKAITVLSQDDDNWFESMSFDVQWLPELIEVLKAAVQPPCNDGMACMMPDDCWRQGHCLVD